MTPLIKGANKFLFYSGQYLQFSMNSKSSCSGSCTDYKFIPYSDGSIAVQQIETGPRCLTQKCEPKDIGYLGIKLYSSGRDGYSVLVVTKERSQVAYF